MVIRYNKCVVSSLNLRQMKFHSQSCKHRLQPHCILPASTPEATQLSSEVGERPEMWPVSSFRCPPGREMFNFSCPPAQPVNNASSYGHVSARDLRRQFALSFAKFSVRPWFQKSLTRIVKQKQVKVGHEPASVRNAHLWFTHKELHCRVMPSAVMYANNRRLTKNTIN